MYRAARFIFWWLRSSGTTGVPVSPPPPGMMRFILTEGGDTISTEGGDMIQYDG